MVMRLLLFIILVNLFSSCRSVGPNYNQGHSHNSNQQNRSKIISKQDRIMRNKMVRARNRADKHRKYNKVKKRKVYGKYI